MTVAVVVLSIIILVLLILGFMLFRIADSMAKQVAQKEEARQGAVRALELERLQREGEKEEADRLVNSMGFELQAAQEEAGRARMMNEAFILASQSDRDSLGAANDDGKKVFYAMGWRQREEGVGIEGLLQTITDAGFHYLPFVTAIWEGYHAKEQEAVEKKARRSAAQKAAAAKRRGEVPAEVNQ